VWHLLAAIVSDKTDRNREVDLPALCTVGQVYRVVDHGKTVAAYVLEPRGPLLWISAFGGRADFDLTHVLAALVEQHGAEFDEIGFRTERRGLVRKAQREGYRVVRQADRQYFMRKKL
jgi:hypothetical protein